MKPSNKQQQADGLLKNKLVKDEKPTNGRNSKGRFFIGMVSVLEQALNCDKLWDINNGRTLCRKCHKKTFGK